MKTMNLSANFIDNFWKLHLKMWKIRTYQSVAAWERKFMSHSIQYLSLYKVIYFYIQPRIFQFSVKAFGKGLEPSTDFLFATRWSHESHLESLIIPCVTWNHSFSFYVQRLSEKEKSKRFSFHVKKVTEKAAGSLGIN